MASPFSIFRKHSGGMMIIMVILSLFLFTLTDLFMDPSANLWLLGILIGGAVFGIAGVGQGRWLQWGIGGAILGAALGYILPGFTQQGGIDSALGVIDEEEIYDLQIRRGVANRFIVGITEATFGEGTARFAPVFGLGRASEREDVIFGKLMRAEADRLGITVDRQMVQDYLNELSGNKLTKTDYIETRNALGYRSRTVDDDLLIDILSDEIKANMAYQTLRPRTTALPPAPEVYWQYFRRLNVRQQMDVAALEVDAFVDRVGEPSDAEINELFTQYSDSFPGEEGPGAPGFRQPFEVKLAYAEVDAEAVEEEIDEVTDEDIQKYYDENKESPMIRTPVMPDFDENKPADPEPANTHENEGAADETKGAGESDPAAQPDAKPDTDAAAPEKTADEAPTPTEDATADETKPAAPKETTPEPADADPPAETEAPAEDTSESDSESSETPTAEDTADEPAAAPEPPADDSCGPFGFDEAAAEAADEETTENEAAADEEAADSSAAPDASESTDPPAAAPEPTDDNPADTPAQPDAAEPAQAEAAPPAEKGDGEKETPAEEPAADDDAPQPASDQPDADPLPLIIPGQQDGSRPGSDQNPPPEPQYEYRELDDALKAEIRDEIRRQRVAEQIDQRIQKAKLEMETLANQRSADRFKRLEQDPDKYEGRDEEAQEALKQLRQEMQPVNDDINARLKAFAQDNGMAYVETPLLGQYELMDQEDYPIGSATAPDINPMLSAQSPTVAATVFQGFSGDEQTNDAQLYLPDVAVLPSPQLDGSSHHYVYWVTDFSYSHVPTLDEVREDVVLEWKRLKARDLVKERAEALAQDVRAGLQKEGEDRQVMSDALKDATITGDQDGTQIAVKTTLPFSWMRTSSAAPNNFQRPQVQLSTIQFDGGGTLDRVGQEFMENVFDDMNDEEVQIVPNADRSKYYVVHVKNRFPTPEIGEDGLRERFANEGKQFAFQQSPILGPIQQDLQGPATRDWIKSVWRRYGIDPDGNPDEE